MLRRPNLLIEGLAIAACTVSAKDIIIYIRDEYRDCQESLKLALAKTREKKLLPDDLRFEFVSGHGAYICGEETALLESLEGKRGMPRLKPPFPTESGFRGRPTLLSNVETFAAVPFILRRGGEQFNRLGHGENAGTRLYCISGHIERPGVYEMPHGVRLRELINTAGGVVGTCKAFSAGGASSGFLPATLIDTPLDQVSLADKGSMLGSAGVVILNDTVNIAEAAAIQIEFFHHESCGQCAPCRIGTHLLDRELNSHPRHRLDAMQIARIDDISWEMKEGSICGLGIAAPIPLDTALRYFRSDFEP